VTWVVKKIDNNNYYRNLVWDGETFVGIESHVKLNGQKLKLNNVPIVLNGSNMLSVRDIFNAVGAELTARQ
jgi:hypothetical protein